MKVPTREQVAQANIRDDPSWSDAAVHDFIVAAIFKGMMVVEAHGLPGDGSDEAAWALAESLAYMPLDDPPVATHRHLCFCGTYWECGCADVMVQRKACFQCCPR